MLQGMPSLAAAASGLGGGVVPGGVAPGAPGGVPGVPGAAGGKAAAPIDYSRYVKRFSSALECGRAFCKDLNYREHFHCIECNSRVFVKKEEMIRHFKWHKKRAESLAHGFMRYSPNDDCSDRYRECSHNRKQTHYHCIKENCDKVYISTSDVQMHANYHRKDSAIIQEGFQRFRATEECRTEYCVFFGQRTTHFHCRRDGCKYTFKNKADMEKHKTYHIKDEQLTRDGFKKFMKQDPCPFEGCRFSGNCNHIHCIRSGCSYVLHSSGQLFSHKRKHERKDSELAYRKYKLAQSMMKSLVDGQAFADQFSAGMGDEAVNVNALHSLMAGLGGQPGAAPQHGADPADANGRSLSPGQGSQGGPGAPPPHPLLALQQHMPAFMLPPPYMLPQDGDKAAADTPTDLTRSSPTPEQHQQAPSWHTPQSVPPAPQQSPQPAQPQANAPVSDVARLIPEVQPPLAPLRAHGRHLVPQEEALWQRVSWRFAGAERCPQVSPGCELAGREHWHCRAEGCAMVLRAREAVLEHARNHDAQDQVSEAYYVTVGPAGSSSPRAASTEGKCHCDQDCPYQDKEKHYHCTWDNCREIILPTDKPFRRLDHYKMHEYSRKLSQSRDPLTTMHLASSIDAMFRRKRGRPPKNRVIEVWNDYMSGPPGSSMPDTPQAIFTSFKLPKPSAPAAGPRQSPLQQQLQQLHHQGPSQPPPSMFGPAASPPAPEDDAHNRASSPNTLELLQEGFMLFEQGEGSRCGDALCSLSGRRHFHCKQPRCFYATDREDVLLMHARDFHDNIDILPGFVFFDRSIDCRLPGCPSNRANRHFHCARPACGYSFVRYSNMAQHEAKHRGEANNNNQDGDAKADMGANTPLRENIVKTDPDASGPGGHSLARLLQQHAEAGGGGGLAPVPPSPTGLQGAPGPPAPTPPQHAPGAHTLPEWMSPDRHMRYGPEQSCSRPFCKLKRKEHYHCNACNQAFSELERLRPHIAKHSTGALSPGTPLKREGAATPEDSNDHDSNEQQPSPAEHSLAAAAALGMPSQAAAMGGVALGMPPHGALHGHGSPFPQHHFNAAMAAAVANQQLALMTSQGLPYLQHGMPAIYSSPSGLMFGVSPSGFGGPHPLTSNGLLDHRLDGMGGVPGVPGLHQHLALKRAMSPHIMPGHQDMSPEAKKARIQNSMRILKDEPVPDGYIRFRFNEDCKYPHCGYREHQTHFHCMRKDCGYSFCDKTRFVQHTARHERLDTLMGGDFQQFRANVSCNRPDCVYTSTLGAMQNKASHFHCLKCEFVCTDTNKVVAHRRQHQKLDSIMAAGFEKFTPSQPCHSESCAHSGKQTHYHCLSCQYAVLGLSQMSAHKFRHLE
ncbi:hypothetical protein FOCC_FOCC002495 [Frankliniella occidentalis]|nr:hypothetical protein FOCC_FOCC002495 [Frankliniella occidentalis]